MPIRSLFPRFSTWRQRIAWRRALRRMLATTPHLVADIGLTEADARDEIARPFWKA